MKIRTGILPHSKLFVEQFIPEEKKFPHPLMFVHGSFVGAFVWEPIASFLAEHGFEGYALSLRGHKPNGSVRLQEVHMGNYLEDVSSCIQELKLQNPVIIGHGMGGLLALMYARDHQQEGKPSAIICISPSPSHETAVRWSEGKTLAAIPLVYTASQTGFPEDPSGMFRAFPDLPKSKVLEIRSRFGPESGLARRQRKRGIGVRKGSILGPMIFFGAQYGESVSFGIPSHTTKKMAHYFDSRYKLIKGTSHLGILLGTHAKEVAEEIGEWLRETFNWSTIPK